MANYWRIVNDVIKEADILLEVIDARLIDESRNMEIEDKVAKAGKALVFVINKCDLVEKSKLEKVKRSLRPCVFMSATKRLGTSFLRTEIMKRAPKDRFKVGVLGYPNTGKSSVINALKGKAAASTAPISGHTKGIQLIRVSKRMYLVDTPGVFPYMEKDEAKHAMIAARTFANIKDPEAAVLELIETFPKQVEGYYRVKHDDDPEEVLGRVAAKLKKLRKGGVPDLNAAARIVLQDWQKGKIRK
ncbi:50S ribosome-binding GTPase [Candidatus Woesearchaeota archaeon]|nr:50S ribosome-binding GTPase [Candidatus Woesearchaeota archaeon]